MLALVRFLRILRNVFQHLMCKELFLQTNILLLSEVFMSNEGHKCISPSISKSCHIQKIINSSYQYLEVSVQDKPH